MLLSIIQKQPIQEYWLKDQICLQDFIKTSVHLVITHQYCIMQIEQLQIKHQHLWRDRTDEVICIWWLVTGRRITIVVSQSIMMFIHSRTLRYITSSCVKWCVESPVLVFFCLIWQEHWLTEDKCKWPIVSRQGSFSSVVLQSDVNMFFNIYLTRKVANSSTFSIKTKRMKTQHKTTNIKWLAS